MRTDTDQVASPGSRLRHKVRSKLLVIKAEVVETKWVSPHLIEVSVAFSGPQRPVELGSHIAIAVQGQTRLPFGAWRRFTVSSSAMLPDCRSRVSWLAYCHQAGLAVPFHRSIQIGDVVSIRIERGDESIKELHERFEENRGRFICVGDETAIGLFSSFGRTAKFEQHAVLLVNDLGDAPALTSQNVNAFADKVKLLESLHVLNINSGDAVVIVGEKSLVGDVRATVRARGIGPSSIASRVYWTPGKVGPE
jgi:NADPH-dependent ferric siderophore reductase